MIQTAPIRHYKCKPMPPEVKAKLELSYQESLDLDERELRCPHCGWFIGVLYSDSAGHFKRKCDNCKNHIIFNLGYFRRIRRYRRYRYG